MTGEHALNCRAWMAFTVFAAVQEFAFGIAPEEASG